MSVPDSSPDVDYLLNLLAVVVRASPNTFQALLGAPIPDAVWETLSRQPGVTANPGHLALSITAAEDRLAALEQADGPLYRQLHQSVLDLLAEQLRSGDRNVEAALVNIFKRLADHLLAERMDGFAALVTSAETWPCRQANSLQWRTYYQGVHASGQGNYDLALCSFDELLDQVALPQHLHARVLNSQANCYRVKGRLENALKGYEESLAIWQTLGDEKNAGKALLNMGTAAYYLQNYAAAEPWLRRAEALFEKQKMVVLLGAAKNGLGLVCRDQGRWDDALRYFQSFIEYSEARGSSECVSIGLLNTGEVLLFQGQIEEAIQTLRQALTCMERRLYLVDVYLHLGLAHWVNDQLQQAQQAFQQAVELAYDLDRQEILPHVEYWLGVVARSLGEESKAEAHLLKAVQIIEVTRTPLTNEELKISLLGRWQQIYEALVLYYLDHSRPEDAFLWAERARARAFAEALLKDKATGITEIDHQLATVEQVQRALPVDSHLLCYFTTGVLASDIPMLQAIPANNPLRKHLLISARTICFSHTKARLTAHECPIDPNLFTMGSPRGYDINRWLEPAVLDHLAQTLLVGYDANQAIKELFIIPHGPLHLVSFTALLSGKRSPASPELTLTYAPNATVLCHSLSNKPSASTQMSALAIGYNGVRQGKALRYTEAEVETVANLLVGDAITGVDKKKEQLRELVCDKEWIHFACHGWFNHELPLASYLETGLTERLTAQEVLTTWRLQARLVTLSACQTGVSRVLRGDEPMGLIRAFLAAGARAVLVTQWPVEDLPTCLFMIRFYQAITSAQNPELSSGLTVAQQWLCSLTVAAAQAMLFSFALNLPDETMWTDLPLDARPFEHPRYWAAFKLVVGG